MLLLGSDRKLVKCLLTQWATTASKYRLQIYLNNPSFLIFGEFFSSHPPFPTYITDRDGDHGQFGSCLVLCS